MRFDLRWRVVAAGIGAATLAFFWDDTSPLARSIVVILIVALLAIRGLSRDEEPPREESLEVLDRVVANISRHPWDPTTLPWLPSGGSPKPVLLVPAADYHLVEVVAISRELNRREIPTRIAIGPSPWERTWPALASYPDLEVFEMPDTDVDDPDFSAVLVMKDTGSLGSFVERCRSLGIPTLGKVEGAQDFWDADTPEARRPYRNLDHVLCQGEFDAEALQGVTSTIVGSTRLERLWWAPPVSGQTPLAVINLNFVYGVRTRDRSHWLDSAIAGCETAGIPYVISVHPAEKASIVSTRVTSISASRLLPRATVLISRFSTMPLEAIARGVPFVYHNPHGETVATYADPMGAFDVTSSVDALARSLTASTEPSDVRARSAAFFARHVDVDRSKPSEARGADVLAGYAGEGVRPPQLA